ncbi:hypothetical protein DY000_02047297 [Brassica cretica]|uniref:Uncharacterized protein n=1 Tax=Brassica cretica TaxID=69181 RepID=A0ABQ7EXP7_BRACR|nr:hypothetical protein DY000_02047297 [Brassica cretica]
MERRQSETKVSQKVELPEESREVFCVLMSVVISEESASGQRLIREQSSSQFQFFGLLTGQMCVQRQRSMAEIGEARGVETVDWRLGIGPFTIRMRNSIKRVSGDCGAEDALMGRRLYKAPATRRSR